MPAVAESSNVILKKLDFPVSTYFRAAVRLDDGERVNWNDFHYKRLIDIPILGKMVVRTSRQVGKSIFNTLISLKYAHVPMFRTIYMCPSQKQAEEFSKLKLGKILTVNEELNHLLLSRFSPLAVSDKMRSTSILNDVYIKSFCTGASLKVGYASDEAGVEKVRGGSADALIEDESQSMLLSLIDPVLDPMLSSSRYKIKINTGTPLDPDDDLCKKFDKSSQHTWVVKCHHCNKHTLLSHLKQISVKGVLCYHCMKPVDVRTGKMVPMNPSATLPGFHFNQLMMPGVVYNPFKYQEILDAVYDPNRNEDKLYAERLGIPKGTTTSIISKEEIAKCKDITISYGPDDFMDIVRNYRPKHGHFPVFGIDWGGGANDQSGGETEGKSHTAEVLMEFYMDGDRIKMRILYHRLYPLAGVRHAVDTVLNHAKHLPRGTLICPDFMGGAYGNSTIFDMVNNSGARNLAILPVRFAQLIALVEARQEQHRVDVDQPFIISRFMKKKIIDRNILLPHTDHAFNELASSFLSMKNLTPRKKPGQVIWVLKANRTNDIMMAIIAGWVGFCVHKNLYRDLMM